MEGFKTIRFENGICKTAGIEHKIEAVSPAKARALLESQQRNRNIRENVVREYAEAMKSGRWRLNGETIKISNTGRLLDGQHRLSAIILADREVVLSITTGLDEDTFDTIDIGLKRTAGDVLRMEGCLNATAVAGAMRLYDSIVQNKTDGLVILTPDEARARWVVDPMFETAIKSVLCCNKVLQPSVAGALWIMFSRKDREAADKFFEDLGSGANLAERDPCLVLRERLLRNRVSKLKLPRTEIVALTIRAWNHRREGHLTGSLKGLVEMGKGKWKFPDIE